MCWRFYVYGFAALSFVYLAIILDADLLWVGALAFAFHCGVHGGESAVLEAQRRGYPMIKE
jgi:hypothetical protein